MSDQLSAPALDEKTDLAAEGALPSWSATSWTAGVLLSVALLFFIWLRNYNYLGEFYDYSIMASAAGRLAQGMMPYRDFTTPLQSLPLYLAFLSEQAFGPRYLSLAYANLLFGIVYFFSLLRLLAGWMRPGLVLLTATTLCLTSYFQHGILWYNSLAISFLTLIVLLCAGQWRVGSLSKRAAAMVCALLYLLSMTKLNFHVLALAMVTLILGAHGVLRPAHRARVVKLLLAVFVSGLVAGPLTEIFINGSTFQQWIDNVLLRPAGRASHLADLFGSNLYLHVQFDYYEDNFGTGIYVPGFLLFALILYTVLRKGEDQSLKESARRLKIAAVFVLPAFFLGSVLLTATNVEIQMLTASFLLVGVASSLMIFRTHLTTTQRDSFHTALYVLGGILLIAGGFSAFHHSRLRYHGDVTTLTTDAEGLSPRLGSYLRGVQLSLTAKKRLVVIETILKKTRLSESPGKVYWGPGLEILERAYGGPSRERLPLWWHRDVTVRDQDVLEVVAALKRSGCEWIFTTWTTELPDAMSNHLKQNYDEVAAGDLTVFRLRKQ